MSVLSKGEHAPSTLPIVHPLTAAHHEEEAEISFAKEAGECQCTLDGSRPDSANVAVESQAGLVPLVAIQHLAVENPEHDVENLLPAEMEGQGGHACVPWRADPREAVEAYVQEKYTRSGPDGAHVPGYL